MARRKLVEEEVVTKKKTGRKSNALETLSILVLNWGKNKSVMDSYKKGVTEDAAQIKQIMMDNKLDEFSSDKFTARLNFKTFEEIDEEGMLKWIKSKLWAGKGSMHCPYIKTVEVIDWEAIEKALYNGDITKKQAVEMDKFKSIRQTPELRLKVAKED